MSEPADELHTRVDELLKRFDEARAREQAEEAKAAQESQNDRLLKDARAKQRSERLWAKLDKLDAQRKELEREETERRSEWQRKYLANVTQADGFAVTCGNCGHVGNFDDFITDKFGFERERGVFQCPTCSAAIRREARAGFIVLTPIQPTL